MEKFHVQIGGEISLPPRRERLSHPFRIEGEAKGWGWKKQPQRSRDSLGGRQSREKKNQSPKTLEIQIRWSKTSKQSFGFLKMFMEKTSKTKTTTKWILIGWPRSKSGKNQVQTYLVNHIWHHEEWWVSWLYQT